MQVTTPPPSPRSFNPNLSIPVEQVIYKALKKRKEERYSNAVTLSEGLRRALDPPASSINDTQPGIPRPTKPVTIPPQAAASPVMPSPSSRYTPHTPPRNPPVSSAAIANAWRRGRKKQERGRGLWFNAALGGLIGCGLLTLVVIIAAIIISSMQASAPAPTQPLRSTRDNSLIQTQIPTLDPTSEAYWEEITGQTSR
jgi:hypothetical protein